MEHVKKQDAQKHQNSPNCIVYEYVTKNPEINIALVEISGRYPAEADTINHECTELGYVVKGSGTLVTQTQTAHLSMGDVILIPHGEKYHWEGNLTLIIAATPAWHPGQQAFTF
jgi:mannose-6-phosphate isomerase class I